MTRVVLHIGAPKTGTSFVQSVLSTNKQQLTEQGILWPGHTWGDQVRAVEDLRDAAAGKLPSSGRWDALVAEVDAHDGPLAVISMEWLCLGGESMARVALDSLEQHEVHVVLTLRDLARAVPAQWQESTQNGHSWTYRDFVDGLTARRRWRNPAGRHFWANQHWGRMLETWGAVVAPDHFWVVTVPPPGSPPTLLWDRFCDAAGVRPTGLALSGWPNESLGAASAELMRRIQAARVGEEATPRHRGALKHKLAKGVLAGHRADEPSLVLPPENLAWAQSVTLDFVEAIQRSGVRVVGDLDDLMPRAPRLGPGTVTDPAALTDAQLLDAAVYGLLGITRPKAKPDA
jgi:hypothetical protein